MTLRDQAYSSHSFCRSVTIKSAAYLVQTLKIRYHQCCLWCFVHFYHLAFIENTLLDHNNHVNWAFKHSSESDVSTQISDEILLSLSMPVAILALSYCEAKRTIQVDQQGCSCMASFYQLHTYTLNTSCFAWTFGNPSVGSFSHMP